MRRMKVRFYLAEPRRVRDAPWPNNQFPASELVEAIEKREGSADRYVEAGGYRMMGLRGTTAPAFMTWSLYKVRHDELPDEEQDGAVGPLDLSDASNLAEGTHIVCFERNIVGVYGRKEAPGRGLIRAYVERVLEDRGRSLQLTPIVRPDVMALLAGAELVTGTLRIAAGNANAVSASSRSLASAARNLTRETSSTSVELTLRAGRSSQERRSFRRELLPIFRRAQGRDQRHRFEKLEVEYISEEAGRQVVDLLGDDITVVQDVEVQASRRSVPPGEGYQAIRDGYNAVVEQLNAALSMG